MMDGEWGGPRKPATGFPDEAESGQLEKDICIFSIVLKGGRIKTSSRAFYDWNYKMLYKSIFIKVIRIIPKD